MQELLVAAASAVELKPTKFSTGSDGYRGQGKVVIGNDRFQVQVMAVRIGSKPKSAKK